MGFSMAKEASGKHGKDGKEERGHPTRDGTPFGISLVAQHVHARLPSYLLP